MDFSKLRSGVVDFSVFIVNHLVWLALTLFSFRALLGATLDRAFYAAGSAAVSKMQEPAVATLVSTYKLEQLFPFLAAFIAIFILHVHASLLGWIGKAAPPDLIWRDIPALPELREDEWRGLLELTGPKLGFDLLLIKIGKEYASHRKAYGAKAQRGIETFQKMKALVLLNIILSGVGLVLGFPFGDNLALVGLFALLAAGALLLGYYHETNISRWMLGDTIRDMRLELAGQPPADAAWVESQLRAVQAFRSAPDANRVLWFGWWIPEIGSTRVLLERLARGRQIRPPSGPDPSRCRDPD